MACPVACGLGKCGMPPARRRHFLYPLVACVSLASSLETLKGAAAGPHDLLVPATHGALPIRVRVPTGPGLDESARWQLIEAGGRGRAIDAEFLPGQDTKGVSDSSQQQLVATIPGSEGTLGLRRFKLVESRRAERTGGFRFAEMNTKSLELREGERPVLVYNFGIMTKPGVPTDRDRSTYIHPIYGLDGEVLTDDFPKDHYHHRGLFWAWPHVRIDGVNYDLWDIRGIHQRFERWLERRGGSCAAMLGVENGWFIGTRKVMQERLWLTVFPASGEGQVLDVELTWIPTDRTLSLAGADEKSYGGFTLRFAPRTNTVITTILGSTPEDLAVTRLPWADLSAQFSGTMHPSGAAVFINPDHPDYPPTWLTRHYGALCVGWPGVTPATFRPGEVIHARYRVWIHRGMASREALAASYRDYERLREVHWDRE